MPRKLELYIPDRLYNRLRKIEKEYSITIQDILLRSIMKTIEEFERVRE